MELDRYRLAEVDFLGAMEVDLGAKICKKKKKMRVEEERAAKRRVEGK